jgi:hypothetical protein
LIYPINDRDAAAAGQTAVAAFWNKEGIVNPFRGIMMLVAAAFAYYRGWQIHTGRTAWLAYGLGTMALALAVWHFVRRSERQRN